MIRYWTLSDTALSHTSCVDTTGNTLLFRRRRGHRERACRWHERNVIRMHAHLCEISGQLLTLFTGGLELTSRELYTDWFWYFCSHMQLFQLMSIRVQGCGARVKTALVFSLYPLFNKLMQHPHALRSCISSCSTRCPAEYYEFQTECQVPRDVSGDEPVVTAEHSPDHMVADVALIETFCCF